MSIHRRIEELEEATPADEPLPRICIFLEGEKEPFQIIEMEVDPALVAQKRRKKRR